MVDLGAGKKLDTIKLSRIRSSCFVCSLEAIGLGNRFEDDRFCIYLFGIFNGNCRAEATPKRIMHEMKREGITIAHIKSHLQV